MVAESISSQKVVYSFISRHLLWFLHRLPHIDPAVRTENWFFKPFVDALFVKLVFAIQRVELIAFGNFMEADWTISLLFIASDFNELKLRKFNLLKSVRSILVICRHHSFIWHLFHVRLWFNIGTSAVWLSLSLLTSWYDRSRCPYNVLSVKSQSVLQHLTRNSSNVLSSTSQSLLHLLTWAILARVAIRW